MKYSLDTRRTRERSSKRRQSGYILLLLMLTVALLAIAMTAAATRMAQQVKRDREQEMIHRGEQYSRAVKKYFKKFGRYPTRLEDLENTNNIRFLRKRYKDPFTEDGKWKLVRFGEVQLGQAGANLGSVTPSMNQPKTPDSTPEDKLEQRALGTPTVPSETDKTTGGGSSFGSSITGQTFGGGPFIGVASLSPQTGIREFNKKKRYNQWLFVYDPTQDRGGLIKGPYNPQAFPVGAAGVNNVPGGGGRTPVPLTQPQIPPQQDSTPQR